MTTSVLPAVPGGRPGAAALAALACAGAALLTATPVAAATPGDHGDVKVRSVGTPLSAARDESRVCRFYLLGKDFGAVQEVAYAIFPLGADVEVGGLSGGISLAGGLGRTEELSLPDGRYKLAWHLDGESGQAGQKVFRVDCGDRTAAAPRPSAGQDGPQAAPRRRGRRPRGRPAPRPGPATRTGTRTAPPPAPSGPRAATGRTRTPRARPAACPAPTARAPVAPAGPRRTRPERRTGPPPGGPPTARRS
ncbi:hypothetical protein IHE55_04585 [Streptomyces pactum]|uniref:Uncharacterized protein n=1 Tax=Streptomyces pactum TaxID=68249 RepID=A0ABS0NFZ1_9ACTN|nr:hypothetical protein [Streptomyces pactum]MBH5334115.1 hypothetical protein [Streptomyces pactum]